MNINLHLLLASGRLGKYKELLKKEFNSAIEKITQKIPIDNVDIVFADDPQNAIPEIGFGGYAGKSYMLTMSFNPEFPNFEKTIKSNLTKGLAHELHHCMRWQNPGYGTTLLEAMISEGLADHFGLEVAGGEPRPWDVALNKKQLEKYLKKVQEEFSNKRYNHQAWFFGKGKVDIPKWTGYTIGFNLVGEYLKKNPGTKPSQLYDKKAEEFVK